MDRSAYLLTSTFNGTSGKLYGVEFNYQQQFSFLPSPLDGFGFQGNLALLDGDFDTPTQKNIPFQGLSDTVLNTSLYYEKYGLSARVSYQWRSDWLDTLGGLGSGEYRNGYDNLDVSVRYAVNDNLTLFADATNLTDASECTDATPGHFATTGSTQQTACAKGSYTNETRQGECTPCSGGTYQDAEAQTACKPCEQGSYCAAGAAAYGVCLLLFRAVTLSELKGTLRREPGAGPVSGLD